MLIAASTEFAAGGGSFGDNHLKERDQPSSNIQRTKKNEEVGLRLLLSFFICFASLLYFAIFFFVDLLFYISCFLSSRIKVSLVGYILQSLSYSFQQHFGMI